MIVDDDLLCPKCGGELKYYDTVKRYIRTKGGKKKLIYIPRFRCIKCGSYHRKLPDGVAPYKHYESDVIEGVTEGLITPWTYGFEDYPCEMTMKRWKKNGSAN